MNKRLGCHNIQKGYDKYMLNICSAMLVALWLVSAASIVERWGFLENSTVIRSRSCRLEWELMIKPETEGEEVVTNFLILVSDDLILLLH